MANSGQACVVVDQIGTQLPHEHHVHDEGVEGTSDLARECPSMEAVRQFVIRCGDEALRQILRGGAGPLGEGKRSV